MDKNISQALFIIVVNYKIVYHSFDYTLFMLWIATYFTKTLFVTPTTQAKETRHKTCRLYKIYLTEEKIHDLNSKQLLRP